MLRTVKRFLPGLGLLCLALSANALEVGELAPDFELPGSDGQTYRLSDYRDRQAVVLAWFPEPIPPAAPSSASRWRRTAI